MCENGSVDLDFDSDKGDEDFEFLQLNLDINSLVTVEKTLIFFSYFIKKKVYNHFILMKIFFYKRYKKVILVSLHLRECINELI